MGILERAIPTSNGCMEFQGAKVNGYGHVHYEGKFWLAHRLSWAQANGLIPEKMLVLHKCDNRPCINPAHLFLGTHRDNTWDAIAKGRMAATPPNPKIYPHWKPGRRTGERHAGAKLKDADIKTIRLLYFGERRTQKEIGQFFGVSQVLISRIVLGKNWTHA